MSAQVGEVVRMQRDLGMDIINDGEWSRDNYIADLLSRIDGARPPARRLPRAPPPAARRRRASCTCAHAAPLSSPRAGLGSTDAKGCSAVDASCLCEMPLATDMGDVPTYAQRFTGGNGLITLNPARVAKADTACYARPQYKHASLDKLRASLQPFLRALAAAGHSPSDAFWTVPSPGTLAVFCEDRCFGGDHVAYAQALARAVAPEYEAIAATGLQLQIDCPDLAMGRHTRHAHLTDAEFRAVAAANVEALNLALRLASAPPPADERSCDGHSWPRSAGPSEWRGPWLRAAPRSLKRPCSR